MLEELPGVAGRLATDRCLFVLSVAVVGGKERVLG